jgi:DNA-binding NtrC family response regulator
MNDKTSQTRTILLVDDEKPLRTMGRRLLQAAGYEVVDAPSGEEALKLLQSRTEPFDLLITDVVMPKMSGYELAGKAKEVFSELKVLLISGSHWAPDELDEELERKTDFLHKPFSPDQLLAKVGELLSS